MLVTSDTIQKLDAEWSQSLTNNRGWTCLTLRQQASADNVISDEFNLLTALGNAAGLRLNDDFNVQNLAPRHMGMVLVPKNQYASEALERLYAQISTNGINI